MSSSIVIPMPPVSDEDWWDLRVLVKGKIIGDEGNVVAAHWIVLDHRVLVCDERLASCRVT